MSEILLETHGLTKQFGRYKAVNRLDMHIRRGAVYGFIGRNGAGKTTFLKMICGLSNPTVGEYSIFGYSGKELAQVRSRVGCLIEAPGIYPNMTAKDNLMIKAQLFGIHDRKYADEQMFVCAISVHLRARILLRTLLCAPITTAAPR